MAKQAFSFKKGERATGLAAIANPYPETIIQSFGRKRIGAIFPPSHFGQSQDTWGIAFQVDKTPEQLAERPECEWRWARMKATFKTEPEARQWVKDNAAVVFKNYTFDAVLAED